VSLFIGARQTIFPPPDVTLVGNRYPVRYLCRALGKGARQRHILCCAFSYGARQTYTFAVRFLVAHGKVFFKKWNFALLFISPLQKHYFGYARSKLKATVISRFAYLHKHGDGSMLYV
jgi:hypothetical protein